jgi:IS5 family transposase
MKITTRCGSQAIAELNDALLAKALEARVLKTNKVRADSTVIEANVAYPSDSGLLARGVVKMVKTAKKLQTMGFATRTKMTDRTRSVLGRARSINANLLRRSDDRLVEVHRINCELVAIARRVTAEADAVVRNARRKLAGNSSGRARSLVHELATTAELTRKIATQTAQRMAGGMPAGSSRIVSLHDPDARAIKKGRLGKPVEFGYKAQIVDNEDGVILDHNLEVGNPADASMLEPAIRRIKARTGRAPRALTADRGYGEAGLEQSLHEAGVSYVVLPTKGKPNAARRAIEKRRSFQAMVRWRTGCEGRISCAKRDFGLARTRLDGIEGARTWCGHGVFVHNLVKVSLLLTD